MRSTHWRGIVLALALAVGLVGCSSQRMVQTAMSVEHGMAGIQEKQTKVADHTIYYMEGGNPSSPTIVMLHGFGGDRDNWTRFARYFTKDYHVIVPDLPGFGKSSYIAGQSYAVAAQTQRLEALFAQLNLNRVHLVGNSMGGYLAAAYAAGHPQQVQSLGLFAAAGVDMPVRSPVYEQLLKGQNPLLVQNRADFDNLLKLVFVKEPYIPAAVRDYFAERQASLYPAHRQIFEELFGQHVNSTEKRPTLDDQFARISMPTQIIWGDRDQVLDISSMQVFQKGIPQARSVVLKDCGHMPMAERPSETAEHYRAFLKTVQG